MFLNDASMIKGSVCANNTKLTHLNGVWYLHLTNSQKIGLWYNFDYSFVFQGIPVLTNVSENMQYVLYCD